MKSCTFFGHRDCPESVKPVLYSAIEKLITDQQVDTFYLGNQGQFDAYAHSTLVKLQKIYPFIRFSTVLAYFPSPTSVHTDDTMFPEGLECVHPRYAIDRRNKWMIDHSDFIICYITHNWGGAARYVNYARHQGKQIIPLC